MASHGYQHDLLFVPGSGALSDADTVIEQLKD